MNVHSPQLPSRGPACPAPSSLEALSVGEPQRPEVEAHVPGCEACRAYVEQLSDQRSAFLKARPAEQFLKKLERRQVAPPERRPWYLAFAALAVAMLTVLVLPRALVDSGESVITKGAAFQVLSLSRGEQSPRVVETDARLRSGDSLRFSYDAPEAGHLLVLDLDGTGKASVFVPFEGSRSLPLKGGSKELLPGTVVLDAATGAEWLVAVFSPKPLEAAPLLRALESQSGAAQVELACDGCTVSTLRIQKVP